MEAFSQSVRLFASSLCSKEISAAGYIIFFGVVFAISLAILMACVKADPKSFNDDPIFFNIVYFVVLMILVALILITVSAVILVILMYLWQSAIVIGMIAAGVLACSLYARRLTKK